MSIVVIQTVKELAALLIRWSSLPFVVRNTYARNKVAILVYHDPRPEVFARHLRYLAKRHRFITLERLVNAIESQSWDHIPPKSVVVTFDDGHRGNFGLLELFKKYAVTPTVYIRTQIVNSNRHFWFKETGIDPEALKRVPTAERLSLLKAERGFSPTAEHAEDERQALSGDEIALLREHVDFQSHSRFHPMLTMCADQECETEIARSKIEVEALSGRECKHFSYPNGDYGQREIDVLKRAGYRSARTIDVGWNDMKSDLFALKIVGTPDDASINRLAADVSGVNIGHLGRLAGAMLGRARDASGRRRPR